MDQQKLYEMQFPASIRSRGNALVNKAKKVLAQMGTEEKETEAMFKTFFRELKALLGSSLPPSDRELKTALEQLKDVAKISVLVPLFIVPGGKITFALIQFVGSKFGFSLLPTAFREGMTFTEYRQLHECYCGGFDKDNLKVPTGGLGIPRVEMPQIAAADVSEFITFLQKRGVQTWKYDLRLSALKVTQKDLNLDKVANMANELDAEQLKKPIIVSKDNFVLDGHHRFVALLNMNPSGYIPVYHVDLEINKLLVVAYEFPKTFKQQN